MRVARQSPFTCTMTSQYFIWLFAAQKLSYLPELVGRSTAQMKAAEQSVNMIYSGYFLAITHDIDKPAMSATDKNDRPAVGCIDEETFIFYIVHPRIFPTNNTV